jgi:hypothetical protein
MLDCSWEGDSERGGEAEELADRVRLWVPSEKERGSTGGIASGVEFVSTSTISKEMSGNSWLVSIATKFGVSDCPTLRNAGRKVLSLIETVATTGLSFGSCAQHSSVSFHMSSPSPLSKMWGSEGRGGLIPRSTTTAKRKLSTVLANGGEPVNT